MTIPLEERFWSKVERGAQTECWPWTGGIYHGGYGCFGYSSRADRESRRSRRAHRVAYELVRGPIPAGLTLDHLCRNKRCVNPDHLEPVTIAENTLRGMAPRIVLHRENRCARGHDLLVTGVVLPGHRWRRCIICHKARRARYYTRKSPC